MATLFCVGTPGGKHIAHDPTLPWHGPPAVKENFIAMRKGC